MKHLNPRQGITTAFKDRAAIVAGKALSVKHLNPRQGITTGAAQAAAIMQQGYKFV